MITDLNAEGEPIPINPPKEDWLGHKVNINMNSHPFRIIFSSILNEKVLVIKDCLLIQKILGYDSSCCTYPKQAD